MGRNQELSDPPICSEGCSNADTVPHDECLRNRLAVLLPQLVSGLRGERSARYKPYGDGEEDEITNELPHALSIAKLSDCGRKTAISELAEDQFWQMGLILIDYARALPLASQAHKNYAEKNQS